MASVPLTISFPLSSVLRLVQEFLLSHNLVASARALEIESGCHLPEPNDVRALQLQPA